MFGIARDAENQRELKHLLGPASFPLTQKLGTEESLQLARGTGSDMLQTCFHSMFQRVANCRM